MTENFSYIRTGSLLARPEPPSDLIPIPFFRPAVSFEDREPAPVDCAILQELAEIKREVRALRVQSATQNASAVSLERAAEMLGCKRSQVFKLVAQGRLERAPKVGRSTMILVASIKAMLAEEDPRKGHRSCRPHRRRPASANTRTPMHKSGRQTSQAVRDPGAKIRKLDI
ncbi:helix-turn-helix domain-containing protein [Corallococcus sp. CA047B]|uniref:helix-turn-helix domain-containing protein n=1 Tax=Corallococcus sp. CA047B TaxID=2316729 RepID=UPI0011C3A2DD|nr:helix-turn-helix domain-containing protein [Corallococcus sp. CA047B]